MGQATNRDIRAQAQNAEQAKPDSTKPGEAKPEAAKPGEVEALKPPGPDVKPGVWAGQVPVAQPPPNEVKAAEPPEIRDLLEPALWLIAALLLGALVFWFFSRWRRKEETRDILSEQLTRFRKSYEQGEMTEEEYRRVHALLAGKMHDQMRGDPLPGAPSISSPNAPGEAKKNSADGSADSSK
jgi:hypothetical protein